jgi:hypothetical protein
MPPKPLIAWDVDSLEWLYLLTGTVDEDPMWMPISAIHPEIGNILDRMGVDAGSEDNYRMMDELLERPDFHKAVRLERVKLEFPSPGLVQAIGPYSAPKWESTVYPPPPLSGTWTPATWPPPEEGSDAENPMVDMDRVTRLYEQFGTPPEMMPAVEPPRAGTYRSPQDAINAGPPGSTAAKVPGMTAWTTVPPKPQVPTPEGLFTSPEAAGPGSTKVAGMPYWRPAAPIEERKADVKNEIQKLLLAGNVEEAIELDRVYDLLNEPRAGKEGISFEDAFSFASGLAKTPDEFEKLFKIATGIKDPAPEKFQPFVQFPEDRRIVESGFNIDPSTGRPYTRPLHMEGVPERPLSMEGVEIPPAQYPYEGDFDEMGFPYQEFDAIEYGRQRAARESQDRATAKAWETAAGFGVVPPPVSSPFDSMSDDRQALYDRLAFGAAERAGEEAPGDFRPPVRDRLASKPFGTPPRFSKVLPFNPVGDTGAFVRDLSGVPMADIQRNFPSDEAFREQQAAILAKQGSVKNPMVTAGLDAFKLVQKSRADALTNKRARDRATRVVRA